MTAEPRYQTVSTVPRSTDEILQCVLPPAPSFRLLWEALADVGERVDLGEGPQGHLVGGGACMGTMIAKRKPA